MWFALEMRVTHAPRKSRDELVRLFGISRVGNDVQFELSLGLKVRRQPSIPASRATGQVEARHSESVVFLIVVGAR